MESIKTSITAPESQQDRENEAQIFQICARAGVSCIGIQRGFGVAPDFVLFQPTVTTLGIPLAALRLRRSSLDRGTSDGCCLFRLDSVVGARRMIRHSWRN